MDACAVVLLLLLVVAVKWFYLFTLDTLLWVFVDNLFAGCYFRAGVFISEIAFMLIDGGSFMRLLSLLCFLLSEHLVIRVVVGGLLVTCWFVSFRVGLVNWVCCLIVWLRA